MARTEDWMRARLGQVVDVVLDRSVVLSLDKRGFARHARHFDSRDLRVDLAGRTVLITGANSAIGLATSEALARRGARVLMACRDLERGRIARDEVRSLSGSDRIELVHIDLSDFEGIDAFASRLAVERLDILLHTAGDPTPARRAGPRIRQSFTTGLFGPLRLTHRLLPKLAASTDARVVFVSSMYRRARRAQVLMAQKLAETLEGLPVSVHAMHPGWTDTPAVRALRPRFFAVTRSILRTPEEGADTLIWLAAAARPRESGRFWVDRRAIAPLRSIARDEREAVWNEVCARAGVDFVHAALDPHRPRG